MVDVSDPQAADRLPHRAAAANSVASLRVHANAPARSRPLLPRAGVSTHDPDANRALDAHISKDCATEAALRRRHASQSATRAASSRRDGFTCRPDTIRNRHLAREPRQLSDRAARYPGCSTARTASRRLAISARTPLIADTSACNRASRTPIQGDLRLPTPGNTASSPRSHLLRRPPHISTLESPSRARALTTHRETNSAIR